MSALQSIAGLAVFCALAWAASLAHRSVRWRQVLGALVLQGLLAALLLGAPGMRHAFDLLNHAVRALQQSTLAATSFVFGYLGGGPPPFAVTEPGRQFVLAFQSLPLVLVISALTSLLVYWRVLPVVVGGFGRLLERTLGLGGAAGFGAAANVFLGMVEAPLFIRPWLSRLTTSELFVLMATGMATIAGSVLMVYASVLGSAVPDALGHLLCASLINVPGAIAMALLMVPETGAPTRGAWQVPRGAGSAVEAIANGAQAGLALLLQIVALLVALLALVHLANLLLGLLPPALDAPLTLQRVLGWVMAPCAWLMGIPWQEATVAGRLLGVKVVLNEFLAYLELVQLPPDALGERSRVILTYALCGFANVGSLGILIAGLGEMAPTRRAEVLRLGPRSVLAGTLATLATGAFVGLWL
jgi:CNT family concentrative nucleoside transporter